MGLTVVNVLKVRFILDIQRVPLSTCLFSIKKENAEGHTVCAALPLSPHTETDLGFLYFFFFFKCLPLICQYSGKLLHNLGKQL